MVINTEIMSMDQSDCRSVEELPLPPGFRFHPTDEELVWHYLRKKADSEAFQIPIIADVDLYKFDPWDLPRMALFGEKEWFFFSPRDRKYPNGARPNRSAASGYWKATGTDKPIFMSRGGQNKVGVKKSLVFYRGRAPKGDKTNWIMHEYRLADGVAPSAHHHRRGSLRLDDWVLCRIYQKSSHAALRADHEQDMEAMFASLPEIDNPGLHNSLAGADSASQHESLLEGMLADSTSEDGSLTTSLPMATIPHNPAGVSVHNFQTSAALTDAWELQQAMATTSHGHNLDKRRFVQQLEASQMGPSMAGHFRQFPPRAYNSNYTDLMEKYNAMPSGRSPISDEESQSTFRSSVYGLESMYPALGYDHQADHLSTASYATPGLTENSVYPSARNPGTSFDAFSYGSLNNFN